MKLKSVKQVCLYGFLGSLVVSILIMSWVEYQMRRGRGTYTLKVDPSRFASDAEPLFITNVSILSHDGQEMIPNQSVYLIDGLIQSVGSQSEAPPNAMVIDATGQFLIPGLVDSHVHLEHTPNDLLLYLANGVTSVRDMGGSSFHLAMRRAIENGQLGPHMFVTSEKIYCKSGFKGMFSTWTRKQIHISKPSQAEKLGSRLAEKGFDGIKISDGTTSEIYWAMIAEGKKHGLPVTGHIPHAISLADLWKSGQSEIAHVEEIMKALGREFGWFSSKNAAEFLTFVENRALVVAENLKSSNISVTTTLWLMQSLPEQKFNLEVAIRDIALAYATPVLVEGTPLRKGWLPGNNSYEPHPRYFEDPEALANLKIFWETYVKAIEILTKVFADSGVRLMAGTDANTALTVPGFSLHDELESLVGCGMSPSQALLSATVVPNEWMQQKAGKIAAGYRADLVLLRENPLANISHTSNIEGVIRRGQWLDRDKLDKILEAVKDAHNRSRTLSIDAYLRPLNSSQAQGDR